MATPVVGLHTGRMGDTNSFSVVTEALTQICTHLSQVSSALGQVQPLADTTRAQQAADSFISQGALASFGTTMSDAIRNAVALLQEDEQKLAEVSARYQDADQQSARSSNATACRLGSVSSGSIEPSRTTQSIRPSTRPVRGSADRVAPVAPVAPARRNDSRRLEETLR